MAAKDTIGTVCVKKELKGNKIWFCACKACEKEE